MNHPKKRFWILAGAAGAFVLLGGIFAMSIVFNPQPFADGFIRMQKFELIDTTVDMNLLQASAGLSQNYDPIVQSTAELRTMVDGIQTDADGGDYASLLKALLESSKEKLALVERYKSLNSTMKNSLNFLAVSPLERLFARVQYHVDSPDLESRESVDVLVREIGQSARALPPDERQSLRDHAVFLLDNASVRRQLLNQITRLPTHELSRTLNAKYGDDYLRMQHRLTWSRHLLFWIGALLIAVIAFILLTQERIISRQTSQLLQSSKLAALGEMAGGVAHEINNPVAVIMLMTDEIRDLVHDPAARKDLVLALDKIVVTAKRIATIVTGLRTFSRDGVRDVAEMFPVETLISETLSFCAERFKSHGIHLEVEAFDPQIRLQGRRIQLSQVLLNLLNNAYDAIEATPAPWVKVSVAREGSMLRLAVTDSGQGLKPETAERIFEPFFTTKQIGKGTGLGLSISRGIVEAHRGKLFVDRASANTSFVLELPAGN